MKKKSISVAFFLGLSVCAYGQQDTLSKEKKIEEVVMVGTRVAPRTSVNTPLPIDAIDSQILQSSGQPTMDKALQYRIPSFNSTSAAVQDATSLLDPFEIRNMGASRTLVLVNGKRKNTSSLMFIQNTIGKGETGADLSAIPNIAIKKVEILRDGASAQYGSDAIAGVMNVILKDKIAFSEVQSSLSLFGKGDGFGQNISAITGTTFGNGGFFTIAGGMQNNDYAQRSGKVNTEWEAATFGVSETEVAAYLAKYPDANNKNVLPKKTSMNILINSSIPLSESAKIYANASYVAKKVNSYANHRTPYWKTDPDYLLHKDDATYVGFTPTLEGDLTDYGATVGFEKRTSGDWKLDVSGTTGGNKILYTVRNTYNESLGADSPINFKPGGYRFNHVVGNVDLSKRFSDFFSFAVGTEVRKEEFEIYAGDEASYINGGAISFPGMDKKNAGIFSRYNLGGYIDTSFDFTESSLLNATARYENYSDFGDAFVWKLSFRQKLSGDKLVFRTSASTGFKAPSLHQLNLAINQSSFSGGTIQIQGLFANGGKQARAFGVPNLQPEKSLNITAGFGFQPTKNFTATLDYYNISVKDRVLLSSNMPIVGKMADITPGVTSASFFINGVDTSTYGFDLVANFKNLNIGSGKFGINFAGNINKSKITGETETVKKVKDYIKANTIDAQYPNGVDIVPFNRIEEAIATTSRPAYKAVLGFDYSLGKAQVYINNTLFGKATWANDGLNGSGAAWNVAGESNLASLEYQPRVVTDLNFVYNINKNNSLNFNVSNLFNVLPKWKLINVSAADAAVDGSVYNTITFNGRYPQSAYDSQHFSIFGTQFTVGYNVKF